MNINEYIRLKGYQHINNGQGFEHVSHAISVLGILEFKKLVRNFHKDPIIKEIKALQEIEEIKNLELLIADREIGREKSKLDYLRRKNRENGFVNNIRFDELTKHFKVGDITNRIEIHCKTGLSRATICTYIKKNMLVVEDLGKYQIKILELNKKK